MYSNGVCFVAGCYGVGKSYLCDKLASLSGIETYSASDIISSVNGEKYGSNKFVADKEANQRALVDEVQTLLHSKARILLAGHFCIFNRQGEVEFLPENVFDELSIAKIVLLEADVAKVIENLGKRDGKLYSENAVLKLQQAELLQAKRVSERLGVPLFVRSMKFDTSDVADVFVFINH